jgi:general secretion pathway protein H
MHGGISQSRARSRGFTLLELLVVIVIAVILTGMVMLSLNVLSGRRETGEAARRLTALIQLASDDAVMQGRSIGIEIRPHSYRFYAWDGTTWQPIADDPSFRERKLPDEIDLRLQLEGQQLVLKAPPAPEADSNDTSGKGSDSGSSMGQTSGPQPQLVALSSGELSAFEITVTGPDAPGPYRVVGSVTGAVDLKEPEE